MSKIKLIVEIEKRTYELIKDKPDNIAESIIANGTPYNPSGDLISREALKKAIKDNGYSHYFEIFDIIDNAPPVEPEKEIIPVCNVTFDKEQLQEIVDKAIEELQWISIKTRPLTEEEKQNAIEEHGVDPCDLEYPFAWHFDCELPELEGGEQSVDVLVTTALGFIKVTNFCIDYLGCPCFEDMDEADEFVAWMPLPKPYESEATNE